MGYLIRRLGNRNMDVKVTKTADPYHAYIGPT